VQAMMAAPAVLVVVVIIIIIIIIIKLPDQAIASTPSAPRPPPRCPGVGMHACVTCQI
jgi:hypothetical protein